MKVMYKIPCILVKVAYNFYVFKVHKVFYKQLKYIPLISRYKLDFLYTCRLQIPL